MRWEKTLLVSLVCCFFVAAATAQSVAPDRYMPENPPTHDVDMGGFGFTNLGSLQDHYGSACASGYAVQDINDDGSYVCVNIDNQVTDIWVDEEGDTMSGDLDMDGNLINNLAAPQSSGDALNLGEANSRYVQRAGDSMNGNLRFNHGEGLNVFDGGDMSGKAGVGGNDHRVIRIEDSNTPNSPDGELLLTSGDDDKVLLSLADHGVEVNNGFQGCGSGQFINGNGNCENDDNTDGDTSSTNELQDLEDVRSRGNSISGPIDITGGSISASRDTDSAEISFVDYGSDNDQLTIDVHDRPSDYLRIRGADSNDNLQNVADFSEGGIDFYRGLDMNNNNLNSVNNVYGNSGADVMFQDRPQSQDGLYIDAGQAYFDEQIRVERVQDRSGSNAYIDLGNSGASLNNEDGDIGAYIDGAGEFEVVRGGSGAFTVGGTVQVKSRDLNMNNQNIDGVNRLNFNSGEYLNDGTNFRMESNSGYLDLRPGDGTHGIILRDFDGSSTSWSGIRTQDDGSMELRADGASYSQLQLEDNGNVAIQDGRFSNTMYVPVGTDMY